jgi:hypothetical protein
MGEECRDEDSIANRRKIDRNKERIQWNRWNRKETIGTGDTSKGYGEDIQ